MTNEADLARLVAERAAGRAAYADARVVSTSTEDVLVRQGAVHAVDRSTSIGLGVRVRAASGAWGFAATRDLTSSGAERALDRALALAEALPGERAAPLAPLAHPPAAGRWTSPCEEDPFAVALEDKVALLLAADAALAAGDPRVAVRRASSHARRVVTAFASTDGAACVQTTTACGAGIAATAIAGDEAQERTYPTSHGGDVAARGWEHVRALDLPGEAMRVGAEAAELLTAPACPERTTSVVIHPEQVALQVHESIGHALELDRIQLGEASYAGTSWIGPEDVTAGLRYGSDRLTVVADAATPGALGSFGWDDEGVAARRTTLIDAGTLRGALSDRQSAAALGLTASGGCARADGFARQPIVRMTNVHLEPGGDGSLEDLIAGTDDGIYLESNRSWSIDDRRLQFQFATEVAREIRGGRLGRLLRNPVYAGTTPRFWAGLDGVGDAGSWRLHGLVNCGKGEPGQVMAVSHGAPPIRVRDVQVRPA